METWKPSEIIVHEVVKDDPVSGFFLGRDPGRFCPACAGLGAAFGKYAE